MKYCWNAARDCNEPAQSPKPESSHIHTEHAIDMVAALERRGVRSQNDTNSVVVDPESIELFWTYAKDSLQ